MTSELAALGFPTQLNVTGTQDITPPSIVQFGFAPTTVDTSAQDQIVTVTLQITDPLSGFRSGLICFLSPSGNQAVFTGIGPAISGDALNGTHEALITIPRFSEIGIWEIYYVRLEDFANNINTLMTSELAALGFPTSFTVGNQPTNQPPKAICHDVTVAAGSTCTALAWIDNGSYDPDGDSISLSQSPAGPYPKGNTLVNLTVTDSKSASSQCKGTVTVVDTTPPTITNPSANPAVLWPPNQKMVGVMVNYNVADNCPSSPNITCTLSVTSNERISSSDYAIVDAHHVKLRADRLGSGNGRIYTITITCTDSSGNLSNQTMKVTMPHDQGK